MEGSSCIKRYNMIVINNTFYEFLYGDNSTIQPSYSLGVAFEVSEDIAASVEQDGIQFFCRFRRYLVFSGL
ncbi:hypothetical protein EMIT079MI2_180076 [Bacillus sp. IT-79MI2]